MFDDLDISALMIDRRAEAAKRFKQLRASSPIHFCEKSPYGAYWSVTRRQGIVDVERNHKLFSSANNVIIGNVPEEFDDTQAFATADPPIHTIERQAVVPGTGLARASELRAYTQQLVENLLEKAPRGEVFDWSASVSAEITRHMAAKLFGFDAAERQQLELWYQILVTTPGPNAAVTTWDERATELANYRARLESLWHQRAEAKEGDHHDVIAGLVSNTATNSMIDNPMRFLGTVSLIAGANEAAHVALDACIVAFNRYPQEWEKLCAHPELTTQAAAEVVRWQSPILHMRRTATQETELGGQNIAAGDKVVLWYYSGNRDEDWFDAADTLRIDRDNVNQHVGFGAGIHRCLGRHIARMELEVVLQTLQAQGLPELVDSPQAIASNFSSAYKQVLVQHR